MKPPVSEDVIYTYIGVRLRHKREHFGWSQRALAEKIGVSTQQFQKYEAGENRMPVARLYHVSMLLNCSIYELLPPHHYFVGL